jgi:hypothetical protein
MSITELDRLVLAIKDNTIKKLRITGCYKYKQSIMSYDITIDNNLIFNVSADHIIFFDIFEHFSTNSSITFISFKQVYLDEYMIREIGMLLGNNVLQTLILNACKIGSNCNILIDPIASNSSLKVLYLSWNDINSDAILNFCEGIKHNESLRTINFANNGPWWTINLSERSKIIKQIQEIQDSFHAFSHDQQLVALERTEKHRLELITWSLDASVADCFKDNYVLTEIKIMDDQPECDKLVRRNKFEIPRQKHFAIVKLAQYQ